VLQAERDKRPARIASFIKNFTIRDIGVLIYNKSSLEIA